MISRGHRFYKYHWESRWFDRRRENTSEPWQQQHDTTTTWNETPPWSIVKSCKRCFWSSWSLWHSRHIIQGQEAQHGCKSQRWRYSSCLDWSLISPLPANRPFCLIQMRTIGGAKQRPASTESYVGQCDLWNMTFFSLVGHTHTCCDGRNMQVTRETFSTTIWNSIVWDWHTYKLVTCAHMQHHEFWWHVPPACNIMRECGGSVWGNSSGETLYIS